MSVIIDNYQKFSFINWFLPLFYILAQYGYGFSNVGTIILIIYTFFFIFKGKVLLFHKPLLYFVIIISIIQLTNMILSGHISLVDSNNFVFPILTLFILSAATSEVNTNRLYKVYSIVGIFALIILYYQWLMLYNYNILPTPIKLLPISTDTYHAWQSAYYRPSSLFSEPQGYASFMIPLLILSLNKRNIAFSLLIILSIILSGSTLGIFLSGIVLVYYLLHRKKYRTLTIPIIIFFSIIIYMQNTNVFSSQKSKIMAINYENDIRLVKGFQIYNSFNISEKLFGIGYGPNKVKNFNLQHRNQLLSNNIIDLGGYVTTISGILISYGIFAGMVFFWVIYRLYRYEDTSLRIFLIVILIASFGQTLLFNAVFLLYYIIYLGISDKSVFNKNFISVRPK